MASDGFLGDMITDCYTLNLDGLCNYCFPPECERQREDSELIVYQGNLPEGSWTVTNGSAPGFDSLTVLTAKSFVLRKPEEDSQRGRS